MQIFLSRSWRWIFQFQENHTARSSYKLHSIQQSFEIMCAFLQRSAEPDSEICDTCHEWKDVLGTCHESYTLSQWQSAAARGCRSCDFRCRVARCLSPDKDIPFRCDQWSMMRFDGELFNIFRIPKGVRSNEYPELPIGHLLSEGTSSDSTFTMIRGWLNDCTLNHAACKIVGGSESFMPKRVLNLTEGRVFLQEDAPLSTYACLSHCWGKNQTPTKTLKATVNDYMTKGIPCEILSKTFQDAVDICRRLQIEYLWIDSLCIIQDSDEDWNEEALKMGDIYAHAFLTIAATKSEDGHGGCYQNRDPAYMDYRTIVEGSVFIRKAMPLLREFYYTEAHTPLLHRAWAFQETLLSTRVIHFMAEEVIWQCNDCQKSESGINDCVPNPMPGRELMIGNNSTAESSWHELVENYSGLQLSFEKDRLPALAAISQRVAQGRAADDRFLAGLWTSSLLKDLLWTYDVPGNRSVKRPTECNAPSWSWTSVESRVWWIFDYMPLPFTRVVTVNVEAIGSPYLGQYSRAELVLEGPVFRTTLVSIDL
ncbi:heterokaryon incompatibility protein-domain-containing protein [Hypoxylon cercidicola]|nr:heterokaryon incompatibility protein-domain-containing protein [Hypoxylon cercidicola]